MAAPAKPSTRPVVRTERPGERQCAAQRRNRPSTQFEELPNLFLAQADEVAAAHRAEDMTIRDAGRRVDASNPWRVIVSSPIGAVVLVKAVAAPMELRGREAGSLFPWSVK